MEIDAFRCEREIQICYSIFLFRRVFLCAFGEIDDLF